MNKFTLSALALVATLGLSACSSESDEGADFEEAGENAEEMMDDAANATEETWEEATGQDEGVIGEMQEADEAGDSMEEAADSMEEGYDEMTQ